MSAALIPLPSDIERCAPHVPEAIECIACDGNGSIALSASGCDAEVCTRCDGEGEDPEFWKCHECGERYELDYDLAPARIAIFVGSSFHSYASVCATCLEESER